MSTVYKTVVLRVIKRVVMVILKHLAARTETSIDDVVVSEVEQALNATQKP